MENILVILGSFLSLPCIWKAESFEAGFQLGVAGGRCEQEPRGWVGKSRCGRHSPPALGPLLAMQTPRPPIASLCRAPLWLQPLRRVPVKHHFRLLSLQAWGSHSSPPMLGSQTFPINFGSCDPSPPLQVLRDPSIIVSSRVHLRRTLNRSET